MKRLAPFTCLLLLTLTTRTVMATDLVSDLRRAVPANAYLAVYGQHNPERDYQRAYSERVLETVRETRLIERVVKAVTSRAAEAERDRALALLDQLENAAAPIELKALLFCEEVVYAQRMEPFRIGKGRRNGATLSTSQHLVLLRLSPEAAGDYQRGIKNIFEVMEALCEGRAAIKTEKHDSATLTAMSLPGDAPYSPAIACVGDVFLFSSSRQFARDGLAMLMGNGKPSKFDDPRLAESLRQLPEPEDAVVFFDGRQQFDQIREMVDTLYREASGNPEADRWAKLAKTLFEEVAILDYLTTVEYTDGHRNCAETFGKLMPKAEQRLLTEMLDSGQPFVDWHRWVPADATAYSLSTGADLHPLYRRMVSLIQDQIPEMQRPLENFQKWQRRIDFDLDVDLLQSFSGECVSVTLPAHGRSALGGKDVVWAVRCQKPARVGWLLERLVEHLNQYPLIKAQQLQLVGSEDLEGLQVVSATSLEMFGIHPVIGFYEGWMFVGTSADAVQKVLNTRAGELESVAASPALQKFKLELEGPVHSVRFVNLSQQIRDMSQGLQQAGAVMPIVLGLVEAQAGVDKKKLEELIPLRVITELLPSVGKVIGEFDFLETQLTVIQDGEQPGTWHEYKVTLVRPTALESSVTSN